MNRIIFGNYTLSQLLYVAGGIVAVGIFAWLMIRLFSKKEPIDHFQIVKCAHCGWKGQVSRYAGRCPKCSQSLGDQMAKKMK